MNTIQMKIMFVADMLSPVTSQYPHVSSLPNHFIYIYVIEDTEKLGKIKKMITDITNLFII